MSDPEIVIDTRTGDVVPRNEVGVALVIASLSNLVAIEMAEKRVAHQAAERERRARFPVRPKVVR